MGSRAVYSVIENGKTRYLYGQWAAAYSLPFFFLNCIETGRDDPDAHLSAADKMIALQDGDRTVDQIDTEQAGAMLKGFGSEASIAMHVQIDMENEVVRFEHNALCYHRPPHDFSISIEDGLCQYIAAKQEAEDGIIGIQSVVDHCFAELLMECTGQSRPVKEAGLLNNLSDRPAVYSITEHGDTRWFHSRYAGSYHGALAVLEGINTTKLRLDSPDHAGEWMKSLQYSYKYGFGMSSEIGRVARTITPPEALDLLASGSCPMHILLDFDSEALTFRQYPPGTKEEISVAFGDAEMCMEWAEGDLYDAVNATAFLENALGDYLESYVPRQTSGMNQSL